MKKVTLTSLLLSTMLLVGSIVITSCGSKSSDKQEQTDEKTSDSAETEVAEVYACPMHPEITGKKGDTCSKCNMALEEVEDDDDQEEEGHDHN